MHERTVQFSGFVFDDYDYNIIPSDILDRSDEWPDLYGICLVHDSCSGGKAFGICDTDSYVFSDSIQGFHKMPLRCDIDAMSVRCCLSFLEDIIKMSKIKISKARGFYSVEGYVCYGKKNDADR